MASAQLNFLSSNVFQGVPAGKWIISNRSDKTKTNIVIDLGVPNYMITGLQIQTADRNFNRTVTVSSGDQSVTTEQTRQLTYDRIIAYDWESYMLNKDRITVDQFCWRYLTISILNEDSPPLQIQAIQVYGTAPTFSSPSWPHPVFCGTVTPKRPLLYTISDSSPI